MVVLKRSEVEEIKEMPPWVLLFGRRKVGKTYLIKNFLDYDVYVAVRRDGSSLTEGLKFTQVDSPRDLMDMLGEKMREGRTVVVDEFQRLPKWFIDEIAMQHPNGKLILSGSSMRVVNEVLGSRSPLLLLIFPYRLGLVRPRDLLASLTELDPVDAVQYGAFLQEPWLTEVLEVSGNIVRWLHKALTVIRFGMPALIGEVFTESERSLSQVYEAILRGLGAGLWRPGDLAHRLHNTGLLANGGSNYILPYIKNLETMGLVTSVPIFRMKKRKVYRLASPLMDTYYYMADKHQTDEVDRPFNEVRENLRRMISQGLERFIARYYAEAEQGRLEYSFDPELDFIITQGRERRPSVVGEVRWGKYTRRDVLDFDHKVNDLGCRKVFIVKKRTGKEWVNEVEVVEAADLVREST